MMIRYARRTDLPLLEKLDRHISPDQLARSIDVKYILMLFIGESFGGWLRYNLFWDNTPFMNMLYILEDYRGKGRGKELVRFWEREMADNGYHTVLTSSLSSEHGQHFFRRNGYMDCGSLLLPGEPLEIIFRKDIPRAESAGNLS